MHRREFLKTAASWLCALGIGKGAYGRLDLYVSNNVDSHLDDLPNFGSQITCQYHGIPVQCGPRGLKGLPSDLYHSNGNGPFTDVANQADVDDPAVRVGLTTVWWDFNNDGLLDLFVANAS
jgi:enediyne biosynthesis protein E4